MEAPTNSIPNSELQERRQAVESTVGTTLAAGESPSPEVLEFFEKYARGEMTLAEVSSAVRTRYGI